MKQCRRCKEEKPGSGFHKNVGSKDGLQPFCKLCTRLSDSLRPNNLVSVTFKVCRTCKLSKPATFFNRSPKNKDGLHSLCNLCRSFDRRNVKYGVTIEQFDEMMLNQGGMCAICDREGRLDIDHDHKTGKVRQLLCGSCNRAIGLLQDSAEIITKAAEYVKKHSAIKVSGS